MDSERTFTTVDELVDHLDRLADLGSDEGLPMTELDHGLQTAAHLAQSDPDDVDLQVAGLVHDLAHPWDAPGQPEHHHMGARAVEHLLGARVAALIDAHVDAKRYLVATDATYRSALSAGSIDTLAAQGGTMSPAEVARFESLPHRDAAVALRRADDRSKIPGAVVPSLDRWIPSIRDVAARHERTER